MKVVIISNPSSLNTKDLVDSCIARSFPCMVVPLARIFVDTKSIDKDSFYNQDVYLFRGFNKNYHQAQAIAKYLVAKGKIVVDTKLTESFIPSKLHEALIYRLYNIPHPRTYFVRAPEDCPRVKFPIVIKDVDSQKGKGVRLCASQEDLHHEITKNGKTIILQEYLKLNYDIRVLCVGSKIVGAIKRHVVGNDFRTNVSLGALTSLHNLTHEEEVLALKAHKAVGYDISGVDLGRDDNGKLFVIETNITPEWQGFKRTTGSDVALEIIRYLEERYINENR